VGLEVLLSGNDPKIGTVNEFPMSLMELLRSCAETLADFGPYVESAGIPNDVTRDVSTMSDVELEPP
jgi:hypothetical protein